MSSLPRAYLFVPGDRPERFAKALASGADAVVLDHEDAVAASGKDAARAATVHALASAASRLVVRINDDASPWYAADLAMLVAATAAAAVQPDGRMVDKPVIEGARRLVARAHP